jgi:hypothetical protein
MGSSNSPAPSELASPPKRRTPPLEQTDEPPRVVESEQVDVEREVPLGENEPVEQHPRDRSDPAFEE